MSSKLRLWFGGAVGLLLVAVLATCGNDGPVTTGMDDSGGLTEAGPKGGPVGPRATDSNPPGWEGSGGPLGHDGFPTDIDFEGVGLGCFTAVAEQYAGLGVHFSGGAQSLTDPACLNSFNYPPHSPITIIAEFGDGILTVDFDAAHGDVGVRYNTFFALTMTCYTGPGGTGGVVGVDAATFPNIDNFGSPFPPNELLQVVGGGILSCVFAGTPNFFTLDDFFLDGGGGDIPRETCGGEAVTPGVTHFEFAGVHTWIGTEGHDVISTNEDGIDTVTALAGSDLVCTFGGPDVVDLGPDEDTVFLGDGRDVAFGKTGGDDLFGEGGPDRLDGGHTPPGGSDADLHNDVCDGGLGNDRFFLCETIVDPPNPTK
jgi:Ca2+-binding RTX toxin-like protein